MILNINQIKDIILNNPNKDLVTKAKLNNKKLRMHIYGEGLKHEINAIDGHEKEALKELRKKYAKSNKALFARLARPIDKVYSARGGSVYYNLTDSGNKQAVQLSMDVKDGLSIRKWIQNKWQPHSLDDPNGLIFIELDAEAKPYPTYKSISTIYDYQPAGVNLDYVIFNVTAQENIAAGYKTEDIIYRVVDDAFDYWIKTDGQILTVLPNTFPNFFGSVPAILNSDFISPECEGMMLSLFQDVVEDADDYIQTGSIRNLAKLRLAYPKYWEYASDCPVCKGEGHNSGSECVPCKGTGKKLMSNPGDAKMLTFPGSKDDPIVAPNVAGFVEFPQAYFDYSTSELIELENQMMLTVWGTETKQQPQPMQAGQGGKTVKTATQVIDDIQPKADRLHSLSEMAEKRHKFIMDHLIQIQIDSSYKGSSINYGRRYMIEGPDEVWNKYSDARLKGASISILDDLLMEYIETKYNGDPVGMNIQLKLLNVEPFIHYTVQQLQPLNASFEDYTNKLYFSEWLATLNDAMLLSYSVEQLRILLNDYVAAKGLQEPAPAPVKLN